MAKSFTAGLIATCLAVFVTGCATQPEPTLTPSDKPPITPKLDANDKTGAMTPVDFAKDVKPHIDAYCLPCHAGPKPKGDVDMTKLTGTEKETFAKMAKMVEEGKMPPEKGKPIPEAEKAKVIADFKALGA